MTTILKPLSSKEFMTLLVAELNGKLDKKQHKLLLRFMSAGVIYDHKS